MSIHYENVRASLSQGWQTWNNESVLSHIWMPGGIGIQLGFKDFKHQKNLYSALIGQTPEEGIVTPYAHAYDNSYTLLRLTWWDNIIDIETALDGEDLVILVTPHTFMPMQTSLLVDSVSLWNRGGLLQRNHDHLLLTYENHTIPVYITAPDTEELFVSYVTPYLSATLSEPVGISTGRRRTVAEIQSAIEFQKCRWNTNRAQYGILKEAYTAMQTCLAWDTIYQPEREAPISTVSRIWNKRWGGYVLFCWDTYFAALMQSLDNKDLAYCNAIEITKTKTPAGFVPNYSCHDNFKSLDRSQPPVGSMTAWMIYEKHGEAWFLEEIYEDLLSWNQWWMDHRRTPNGLLAWGTDPFEPVTGHYLEIDGVNDWEGAAYESGLDNSPMYDDIPFDTQHHILCLEDVGLTGLYIKDCYSLASISEALGHTQQAALLRLRASDMEDRMEQLWDENFGMYLNRRTDTGAFEYRLSPFHFHALFSKKVGAARAKRMITEHFLNPKEFWGDYILPSIARNDPAYPDQIYWRGRIWAPMNFLTYMAIREYPLPEAQEALVEKSLKLILQEWTEKGHVHENYDGDTGEGCNSPRSDKFYHWGGLLSFIGLYDQGYYHS